MKSLQLLSNFFLLSGLLFLTSCTVDVTVSNGDDDEDDEITSIEHTISADLGSLGNIDFDYDECDINESNSVGTITVEGVKYDKITLQTRLRQGSFTLGIRPVFLIDQSSNDDWKDILDTDLNDQSNPNFGLEVEVQRGQKNYTSTSTATINGTYSFVYNDGFEFELSTDDDFESDCNDDELLELSGDISGILTNKNTDGTEDTIIVNIPNFEILFIPE